MPIRRELRPLYPPHWRALSATVRFGRAGGRCGQPHKTMLRCLPDGRWFCERTGTWRDGRNRPAHWPNLLDAAQVRTTKAVLAAAHLNHDPRDNRLRNLHDLCQRCHLLHDRAYHRAQRGKTLSRRWAVGDLFFGLYTP